MTAPQIGVVIPTWNSARTLPAALLSAKQQEGSRAEIIVADSGSGDGTLEICANFGIRTIYVPPGNMYHAINEGLRQTASEWVTYLNSDDFVYSDTYQRLIATGMASGADVVYGGGDFVDAQGRLLYSLKAPAPRALRAMFNAMFFGFMPHAAVFRKAVFEELGGFDESFRHIADMEFFARACLVGRQFAAAPGPPVAAFRIHAGQISAKERDVVRNERARLKTKWGHTSGVAGWWAIARWRLGNVREYLLRWLRTGSLRRSL